MKSIFAALYGIVVIIQLILHYLGWLGVILGVIALLFQNWERGKVLVVSGLIMIGLKYLIGAVFILVAGRFADKK